MGSILGGSPKIPKVAAPKVAAPADAGPDRVRELRKRRTALRTVFSDGNAPAPTVGTKTATGQ